MTMQLARMRLVMIQIANAMLLIIVLFLITIDDIVDDGGNGDCYDEE